MAAKSEEVDPRLPRITETLPMVPFKVVATGIPFYLDKECKSRVADATIAIIQALDPDDDIQELDLVPTTKTYQQDSYVTLAFDNKKIWEECYYRDPETDEVRRAWRIHVNFIGELVSAETVRREKARLEDLEIRVQQKIRLITEHTARAHDQEPLN